MSFRHFQGLKSWFEGSELAGFDEERYRSQVLCSMFLYFRRQISMCVGLLDTVCSHSTHLQVSLTPTTYNISSASAICI